MKQKTKTQKKQKHQKKPQKTRSWYVTGKKQMSVFTDAVV